MYAKAIKRVMLGDVVSDLALPIELIPVDRVMQRWDTAHRGGYPVNEDKDPVSRPPALDDETAMQVDDIVRATPKRSQRIILLWYRSDLPNYKIADKLGCTPRSLHKQHHLALHFLRHRFMCSNHITLLNLLRVRSCD